MARKGKGKAVERAQKTAVVETPAAAPAVPVVEDDEQGELEEVADDILEGDEESEEDVDDDESDSDDEGVDQESMDKLMGLLGDIDPAELGLEDGDPEDEGLGAADALDGEEDDDDEDFVTDDDEEFEDDDALSGSDDDVEDDLEDVQEAPQPKARKPTAAEKKQDEVLDRILARFKIDVPFFETQTLTYPEASDIPDAEDDLQRELQFYKQSLWAAQHAYKLFKASSVPFTRPDDYYAEMLKSDDHMERVRQKLLDESASIKASEAAKKQRHLKKFGKQVQVEKLKERERAKKDLNDKVREFKKKRKGAPGDDGGREDFDIEAVNEMSSTRAHKRARNASYATGGERGGRGGMRGGKTRTQRDSKFGHSKTSRRPKENDRESANDIFGKSGRGGKAAMGGGRGGRGGRGGGRGAARGGGGGGRGGKRLGKSRRN